MNQSSQPIEPSVSNKVARYLQLAVSLIVFGTWLFMLYAGLKYVADHTANVPIYDEWDIMVPVLTGEKEPTLEWLWSLHGEHRSFLLRLSLLGLAKVTDSDFRAALYVNVVLLAGVALAMILVARKLRGRTSIADAFFPLALLNCGHFENLLSGIQIAYVLVVVFAGIPLLVIVLRGASLTLGAGALAGLCLLMLPLCGAHGLAFLPALGLWLAYAGVRRWRSHEPHAKRDAAIILSFVVMAFVLTGLYFIGYQKYEAVPDADLPTTLEASVQALAMGFDIAKSGTLGWPISGRVVMCLTLITVGVLVWGVVRGDASERSRALGLLLYLVAVICLALALGRGRGSIGMGYRYALLTVLFLCCAYYAWGIRYPVAGRFVQWFILIIVCIQLRTNVQLGQAYGGWLRGHFENFEQDLLDGMTPEQLGEDYAKDFYIDLPHSPAHIAEYIRGLHHAGIGIFRDVQVDPQDPRAPRLLQPLMLVNMTWERRVLTCTGDDPLVIFPFSSSQVRKLHVTVIYDEPLTSPAELHLYWRMKGSQEFTHEERYALLSLKEGPAPQTFEVAVNGTLDQIMLQPRKWTAPFRLQIRFGQ